MSEIESTLRAELEQAVPPFAPDPGDWADVLRRAGDSDARRPSPRVGAAATAAVVAVALLATPALGLGDRLRALVGADPADQIVLVRARLSTSEGAASGTFTVRARNLDVHKPGAGRLRLFKGPLRWTLVVRGLDGPPAAAHLHLGARRYTLCAPCPASRATGTLRPAAAGLLQHRAVVDVHTRRSGDPTLRGRVEALLRRPG